MRKMIGIVMMGVGLALLVSGYFVYSNKEDKLAKEEVEGQIQAVVADGVFTDKEKEHIGQLAKKHNINKEELFNEINEKLAANDGEAETEIIDQDKKKGDDFEKFIVKKFNNKLFTIKQWAGDKYVDGIFDRQTQQPDLIIEFKMGNYDKTFAVECKWRKEIKNGNVQFSYDEQLGRYKQFEKKETTDVYIALGVGGKASKPEWLYLIPLKDLNQPSISISKLKKYWKPVDANFYLNKETEILDISFPPKK